MSEEQGIAGLEIGLDGRGIQRGLHWIWHEHHDQVCLSACGRRIDDAQASLLGLGTTLGSLGEANANIDARVAKGHCVGVTLAAEAKDCDYAVLDDRQIRVIVIKQFSCHRRFSLLNGDCDVAPDTLRRAFACLVCRPSGSIRDGARTTAHCNHA